jgi:hypothetical protein
MTLARLVPLHIHGALEAVFALVVMAAPFALGFEATAMVATVTLGALMLSVALATHAGEESLLPISIHAVLDTMFALAMAAAAVGFAIAGDATATVFLAVSGVALILLTSLTRYSQGQT